MPLNCTHKMLKMVDFTLCIFHHNKKLRRWWFWLKQGCVYLLSTSRASAESPAARSCSSWNRAVCFLPSVLGPSRAFPRPLPPLPPRTACGQRGQRALPRASEVPASTARPLGSSSGAPGPSALHPWVHAKTLWDAGFLSPNTSPNSGPWDSRRSCCTRAVGAWMPSRGLVSASLRSSAVAGLPGGLLPEFHAASGGEGLPLLSLATYRDFHGLSPTPASPAAWGSRCRRRLLLKGRTLRPGLDAWARVHCRLCWSVFLSHPSCDLSRPRFLCPQSSRLW